MPMIDRHCSTYHRTLGSVQFQFHSSLAWAPAYSLPCTLLETFVDQKLYLYQLISRMVKYYQNWIFSVIIIINIHENDRFQWSLYLYIIVFMNHIVTLRSYSHINSSSYSHVPAFPDNWHLRRIDNQRALRRMVKVIIFSLLLNSDPWKSSYPATLLGLNIMDVTKFLAGKFCSS